MQYSYQPVKPASFGYRIQYRANEHNHCPGCGRSHWIIGRSMAECANCATALPINMGGSLGHGLFRSRGGKDPYAPLAA